MKALKEALALHMPVLVVVAMFLAIAVFFTHVFHILHLYVV